MYYMTGRALEGDDDEIEPRRRQMHIVWAIGVFFSSFFIVFLIFTVFTVFTGYNLHSTRLGGCWRVSTTR